MSTVEIMGPVNLDHRGDQVLVKRGDEYFVVSSARAPFGFETLAFESDEHGNIDSYTDVVAGGRGMTRAEVIEQLEEQNG